jgi:hypothetical protein
VTRSPAAQAATSRAAAAAGVGWPAGGAAAVVGGVVGGGGAGRLVLVDAPVVDGELVGDVRALDAPHPAVTAMTAARPVTPMRGRLRPSFTPPL